MTLRNKMERFMARHIPGGHRYCPLCERRVRRFLPYRYPQSALAKALNCVGSDVEHFLCPKCGAHDRERHLLLYARASGLLMAIQGKDILHFAPESQFAKVLVDHKPKRYVACDLHPQSPHIQSIDMLHMPFEDESFDLAIANHVLEHVEDDRKALAEITRVLKIGGHAVLQTPFSDMLHHTWQDDGIQTERARLQAYGQGDHVRLYGRDIVQRIQSAGLISEVQTHKELLAETDPMTVGVNGAEPFFLFLKLKHTN